MLLLLLLLLIIVVTCSTNMSGGSSRCSSVVIIIVRLLLLRMMTWSCRWSIRMGSRIRDIVLLLLLLHLLLSIRNKRRRLIISIIIISGSCRWCGCSCGRRIISLQVLDELEQFASVGHCHDAHGLVVLHGERHEVVGGG